MTTNTLINGRYTLEDIENHSHKIIKLIKKGDYVRAKGDTSFFEVLKEANELGFIETRYDDTSGYNLLIEEDIVEIITKERFGRECYKLEDKQC